MTTHLKNTAAVERTEELKMAAQEAGADLVGIAGLEPFKREGAVLPPDLLAPFTYAVSLAVRLDDSIINAIENAPTPDYARHYRAVNAALDGLSAGLVEWIVSRGFSARAVPASRIEDEANLLAGISHKAVARMAGLGWQGKSLLIVSPQYGPRIRLSTVLTDLPLQPGRPVKNRCGTCDRCAQACPASAIRNIRTADRYASPDAALRFNRCVEQTLQFKARPGIGSSICGVCVKVCPFGRRSASGRGVPIVTGNRSGPFR